MQGTAVISTCGRYRYVLRRTWAPGKCVLFVMLNPSTADHRLNDPTIRRCIDFATNWGYGSIRVVNLFPLRCTDPLVLLKKTDWTVEGNIDHIREESKHCGRIVCAWGNGALLQRVLKRFPGYTPLDVISHKRLYCIEQSAAGTPKHPLYLRGAASPKVFHLPLIQS